MTISSSEFLKLLSQNGISHLDRAVALIWFKDNSDPTDSLSMPDICSELENAGYSRQNKTRLKRRLASDLRVLKATTGGYKINPLRRQELDALYSQYTRFKPIFLPNDTYEALKGVSSKLADSYKQILIDLEDPSRVSWAGTAHEIRQVLSSLLLALAPDEVVISQSWYVQQPQTNRPTQSQRARYVLQLRGANSSEAAIVQRLDSLDSVVEEFARLAYSRASDAAHTHKSYIEAKRIMKYTEAIIFDLIG